MHSLTNKPFRGLAVLAAGVAAVAGCSGNKATVSDTAHAANVQQSIDAVKNNPHIPDAAKAQILSSMQQQRGTGAKEQPH